MTLSTVSATDTRQLPAQTDWVAVARALGPGLAARAPAHDANDSFVADNYRDLKERRVFGAAVPAELGGGGASHGELCAMLGELARHCGSTALALSMHTHLIGANVWLYHQGAAVAPMLQRVAAEQLVLTTTSANDWLDSVGRADRVEGGFRITGRKRFASGSPGADLLITSAPYDDPDEGPTVLHFAVPLMAEGISVLDNWRTMGMRATGSNDITLDGVFVADAAVSSRRARGACVPFFNVITAVAVPLIMSVYLGVAEAARDLAIDKVAAKRDDPDVWYQAGEMENALTTGRLAVQSMIDICADYSFPPTLDTANAILIRKTIAAQALLSVGETALTITGGGGFFRGLGLERMLRDLHAAQFHPLQPTRQHRFSGRMALGLDPVG